MAQRVYVAVDRHEPEYSSCASAVSNSSTTGRSLAARDTTALIAGLEIQSFSWTRSSLYVALSSGKAVSFFLSGAKVEWEVAPAVAPPPMIGGDASPVVLCFPTGTEKVWDPTSVLLPRRNKKIIGIFASPAWVFMYTAEQAPVLLASLALAEGGRWLYWSETD